MSIVNSNQGDDGVILDDDHQEGVLFESDDFSFDEESSIDEGDSEDLSDLDDELSFDGFDEEDDFDDSEDFEEDEEDLFDQEMQNLDDDLVEDNFEELYPNEEKEGEADVDENELIIPADVSEKFSGIVTLIKGSESMNEEERQYWIDVLPTMNEEQLKNLKTILSNEKKQIQEAEKTYQGQVSGEVKQFGMDFDKEKYVEKQKMLRKMEEEHEENELQDEAALLDEIESMEA